MNPDGLLDGDDMMSPAERAAVIDASIVHDWSAVRPEFRAEIDATARRLGDEHRSRA